MTYEGARGNTATEMQSTLHFPKDETTRRSSFANIYNQINKKDKEYKLSTANALWAHKDYKFLEEYLTNIEKYYGGKTINLDFSQSEQARKIINDWVEDQTNNKIKNLIAPGVLNGLTRLVLTNAVYFKGTWLKPFDKKDTKEEDFKISENNVVRVSMMKLTGKEAEFKYMENDELQAIELPYDGEELSMIIFLPKKELDLTKISEWKNEMVKRRVDVYLPKFTFETKYSLPETLKELGMIDAFSDADFSGMDGTRNLFISDVIHQAFVEVNEEGTEAAAATAVVMYESAIMKEELIPVFKADHPFAFIIQQK